MCPVANAIVIRIVTVISGETVVRTLHHPYHVPPVSASVYCAHIPWMICMAMGLCRMIMYALRNQSTCSILCITEVANQVLTGQSVRTKPYSRVQMASRPRGDQNRKLADDQAVRELASELRSMSQQQELSNKQQRDQWEAILSELQEIQKNN